MFFKVFFNTSMGTVLRFFRQTEGGLNTIDVCQKDAIW